MNTLTQNKIARTGQHSGNANYLISDGPGLKYRATFFKGGRLSVQSIITEVS